MMIQNRVPVIESIKFFEGEMTRYKPDDLIVQIKFMPFSENKFLKYQSSYGYCIYPFKDDLYRIVCHINSACDFPVITTLSIPSRNAEKPAHDSETEYNLDDAVVWILGHEVWHYLCESGREQGNTQAKANVFGFKLLRAYKQSFL